MTTKLLLMMTMMTVTITMTKTTRTKMMTLTTMMMLMTTLVMMMLMTMMTTVMMAMMMKCFMGRYWALLRSIVAPVWALLNTFETLLERFQDDVGSEPLRK